MAQQYSDRSPAGRGRFDGREAEAISLQLAASWTAAYRRRHPGEIKARFFGRDILGKILAQPGCQGLRVYYALDPADLRPPTLLQRLVLLLMRMMQPLVADLTPQRQLLIVGADATQSDQLPHQEGEANSLTNSPDYLIAEMSIPCPNQCGTTNALNSDAR